MKDLMGMMGKVKELQEKMSTMQDEIAEMQVDGTSGGDLVKVTLNGKGVMMGLSVDPSLLVESEAEILEDLILAAHNDAKGKADAMAAEKTAALTEGLPIPPGMKLPF